MSVPTSTSAGTLAIGRLLAMLEDAGIEATRDAGAFFPQPVGVLVGIPTLTGQLQSGARTFTVPVLVVSGDPFTSSTAAVDRALALADDVAFALAVANYRPSSWSSSRNAEPLPALELDVTVTVPKEALP